jgi:RNA polymerase sigma-70 factor (ECF subfamily)
MNRTDETLMMAVQSGDLDALGILFERHHAALFGFFCRVTGSRSASEDLTQDVFVRILKYRERYRDQNRFRAWMYRIAQNARIDYYRRRPAPVGVEFADEPASSEPLPQERLEQVEKTQLLEEAFGRLPAEKRELLALARIQGLRHEEIADSFGISVGAVKVRVHRAVRDLRDEFFEVSNRNYPCHVKRCATSLRPS